MPTFNYWRMVASQREERRLQALKRGERAPYGYWKDKGYIRQMVEPGVNDIPSSEFIRKYRLEITFKQANALIADGAETINMVIKTNGKYYLTYKNALKLPQNTFIRDINSRWCFYRNNKFYKLF